MLFERPADIDAIRDRLENGGYRRPVQTMGTGSDLINCCSPDGAAMRSAINRTAEDAAQSRPGNAVSIAPLVHRPPWRDLAAVRGVYALAFVLIGFLPTSRCGDDSRSRPSSTTLGALIVAWLVGR